MRRNCLNLKREIKTKQIEILDEDNDFLTKQMVLIGKEIDLLRDRQNELTMSTRVDDIIQLASESGYELGSAEKDDAKSLLDKVTAIIAESDDGQNVERFALIRLKDIVQERSDYLSIIKYLSWVIQQKIQYSKQLLEKRTEVRSKRGIIQKDIKTIRDEIKASSIKLAELAKRIRYYWARPIVNINADISYAYKEKSEIGGQLREVGDELHDMASWHSNDQDKWERLKSEREDLSSDIDSLVRRINSKKRERKQWYEKRNFILQLCKKYEVPLIQERKKETDEERIIEERLVELEEIRAVGKTEAEKVYEQKRKELIISYEHSRGEIELDISSFEKQFKELETKCGEATKRISIAVKKVEKLKAEDDRFFLLKIVSDIPGMEEAEEMLSAKKKTLANLEDKRNSVAKLLSDAKKKMSDLDKQHEKDLSDLRPICLRPTYAEAIEEKKLIARKEEIEKRRKEGGRESKNRFSAKPPIRGSRTINISACD